MKPHKHAELIKAWADGAKIQVEQHHGKWLDVDCVPFWYETHKYRIKPTPKEDIIYYGVLDGVGQIDLETCFTRFQDDGDQIKLTFDGETRKLKSADVL